MKKIICIILLALTTNSIVAQGKGARIGFIDMEYILEKVPAYAEANNQLEQKAQKWKIEIEEKKAEIKKLKDALQNELPLLTKELIEEREDEIKYLEEELFDYQQKRFGPNGDLIIQKTVLVKPIQDQVFTIIQDLATKRQFDFVFDKSSEVTMLFAAKQHDISDLVIKRIISAEKREKMTSKELKKLEQEEEQEELRLINPQIAEREKQAEERKNQRDSIIELRKKEAQEKKDAIIAKRQKMQEEKNAKKSGTQIEGKENEEDPLPTTTNKTVEEKKAEAEKLRQQKIDERNKIIEQKKKELEDRKQKALEARDAAKKAAEEKKNKKE